MNYIVREYVSVKKSNWEGTGVNSEDFEKLINSPVIEVL